MMLRSHLIFIQILLIFTASFVFSNQTIQTQNEMIRDVDTLLRGLTFKDPQRVSLMLRLADLHFDQSIALNRDVDVQTAELKQKINFHQRQALSIYQATLKGEAGRFEKITGSQALKVQFQVARLSVELGQFSQAEALLGELSHQDELLDIKREASLRLAEIYGERNSSSDHAKAEELYRKVIQLCSGLDVCSYAYYRLAWLQYKSNKLEEAISLIYKGLWDAKGQVREESLRDYIVFLSNRKTDGSNEISLIEDLVSKTNRANLFNDLTEAFFANGNKIAGTKGLDYINSKSPSRLAQIRLIEEFYGLRDWDNYRRIMDQLSTAQAEEFKGQPEDFKKSESILRRVLVQLDGERKTQSDKIEDFQKSVMLYLRLAPQSEIRSRMIDGWLASESNKEKKIQQLENWIAEEKNFTQDSKNENELRLRKMRASLAQEVKNYDVVIHESLAIASLIKTGPEVRKFKYLAARALYDQKKIDEASVVFKELASLNLNVPNLNLTDEWAIQSQHILLDIYAQKKQLALLIAQAQLWVESPLVKGNKALEKEYSEFRKILDEARFEKAASEGETMAALQEFKTFCFKKEFFPQSCENLKILAVKLKDQTTLIEVLKFLDKKEELLSEYEASGAFREATPLVRAKLTAQSTLEDHLKIALFYELGGEFEQRNQFLKDLIVKVKKMKDLGAAEPLLYRMLSDAGLLSVDSLNLPWSASRKLQLAHTLYLTGKETPQIKTMLLASKETLGAGWSQLVVDEVKVKYEAQAKVSFYGQKSESLFKLRVKKLTELKEKAHEYLNGSDHETRFILISSLKNAYATLAQEILNTPFPSGLDEATIAGLKKSLQELSDPFLKQSEQYQVLAQEELQKVPDTDSKKGFYSEVIASQNPFQFKEQLIQSQKTAQSLLEKSKIHYEFQEVTPLLSELKKDPSNQAALSQLKSFYENKGKEHLASYYQGRVESLKKTQGGL